jgi:hypothetical protein
MGDFDKSHVFKLIRNVLLKQRRAKQALASLPLMLEEQLGQRRECFTFILFLLTFIYFPFFRV